MNANNWIALVAILVAPTSALAGAWVNSFLAAKSKATETVKTAQADALIALGRMKTLLVDAQPSLILNNELREYAQPKDALAGLYKRWLEAREPLVLMSVTHPSPEVRDKAFALQAQAEMALRTVNQVLDGLQLDPMANWRQAAQTAGELGQLLSPFNP
jgi:hypothetical protein